MTSFGLIELLESVAPLALAAGLVLHIASTLLRVTAWRNVLAAAHPVARVRWRTTCGAVLAGEGANALLPVRGGDVLRIFLGHRGVAGSSYASVTSSLVPDSLLDVVIGAVLAAFVLRTGAADGLQAASWAGDPGNAVLVAACALALSPLVLLAARRLRRLAGVAEHVKQGVAILGSPRRYVVSVALVQLAAWALRAASVMFLLRAFGIDAGVTDAAMVLGAGSVAAVLPAAPGGLGPKQALLVWLLAGAAPPATVVWFGVGSAVLIAFVNVLLGATAIALTLRCLPWRARVVMAQPAPARVRGD